MTFANIENLRAGQEVFLDGGFTCHLPGATMLCDNGEGLYFHCCDGMHSLSGQIEEDGTVTGVYVEEPQERMMWEQADACPVADVDHPPQFEVIPLL